MLMRIFCLLCHFTLASLVLVGCQPVHYGATSILDFEEQDKHGLTGKNYKDVILRLGEPSDIILDKYNRMIWTYEVDESSSNPMEILPTITVGRAVKRKVLLIGFSTDRRVIGVDIENLDTRIVGLIGHIDHGTKKIEAKRRVRYVLDRLGVVTDIKREDQRNDKKPQSLAIETSNVEFKFNN